VRAVHLGHRAHEIDMARQRMAADLGAVPSGALDVDAAARLQSGQRGERQALLHDVEVGRVVAVARRDGEAHAVHGHAGADDQAVAEAGREAEAEAAQAGPVDDGADTGDALDDAGEHGRDCPAAAAPCLGPTRPRDRPARGQGLLHVPTAGRLQCFSMDLPPAAARALRQEIRFTHVSSGARIAWSRSGRVDAGAPVLVRAAHWMTHVEYDAVSPIFRPWLERLGRELRLVCYDERGCGLSGPDETPLGLATSLEELAAVADAIGESRVALLGISGGAATAVAYAAQYPQRVSHLVLLGAYTHGLLQRSPSAEGLAYFEAIATLMQHGWGQPGSAVQQFFSASLIPDATVEQREAMNEQQRRSCDGRRAAALFRARSQLDARPLLARVQCPTLVMHSEGDATVKVELGRDLAAAIPGARFEALHSRNHLPLHGEPAFERFCVALTDFVHQRPAATDQTFTARERELMALVARGLDNLQIGAHLGLADKTVRNQLSRLYQRLGVDGRSHAVVRARELGF
jgi:pimeloyl-ACP methyl ester carboxylesterase